MGGPRVPALKAVRYRWLEVGGRYRYSARSGDDSRRGQVCVIVAAPRAGGVSNVLVEFEDGHRSVCPAGVLKPLKRSTMK
jgi:hypothetical protein